MRRITFDGLGAAREGRLPIDGVNPSVPWRRLRADRDAALSPAAIEALAETFSLAPAELRRFDIDLRLALDPDRSPITVPLDEARAIAAARGKLGRVREMLQRADELIWEARREIDDLDVDRVRDGLEWRRLREFGDDLERSREALVRQGAEARRLMELDPPAAFATTAQDHRVGDLRRRIVLGCIFEAWLRWRGRLGYTSDPVQDTRGGELIAFVNAVAEHVTDPATRLSPETIVKDLKAFRAERTRRATP